MKSIRFQVERIIVSLLNGTVLTIDRTEKNNNGLDSLRAIENSISLDCSAIMAL